MNLYSLYLLMPVIMLDIFDNVTSAITQITNGVLKIVIPGAGLMILICGVAMIFVDQNEHQQWAIRLRKIVKGAAIALCASAIVSYVVSIVSF